MQREKRYIGVKIHEILLLLLYKECIKEKRYKRENKRDIKRREDMMKEDVR